MRKKPTVTIGIPTFQAQEHLVKVVDSVRQQNKIKFVEKILIAVDGNDVSEHILNQIKHPKLRILFFRKRQGQSQRINDLIKNADSELLLLTNDDVLLAKDAIEKVVEKYIKTSRDLISVKVCPTQPKTFLERVLLASLQIKQQLIRSFPANNTYLTSNGRFIVLSKKLYKNLILPKKIINSDAYIYFYAKEKGYLFSYIDRCFCYYKEPSRLNEYVNQVRRFQTSYKENRKFFSENILKSEYRISVFGLAKPVYKAFLNNPLEIFFYFMIFIYVRAINFLKINYSSNTNGGTWNTDMSTKSI